MNLKEKKYEVITIGAGIGGVVCSCYLAKAGLKVLLIEQHYKVGGYCTSFKRGGFDFDAGLHCLEGCGEDGKVRKIIDDLGLSDRLNITRTDPSELVILPDYKINIWNNSEKTLAELQTVFPEEAKSIEKFFAYITKQSFLNLFTDLNNMVFKTMLDNYFNSYKLKAFFQILLKNIGLPSNRVAAINAVLFLREYLFDGGYYPEGGFQRFSDVLAERFKEFGGELLLSTKVEAISIKNKECKGVFFNKNDFIESDYVVSNCDATQTFCELIDSRENSDELNRKLQNMLPSLSVYMVFLGMESDVVRKNIGYFRAIWHAKTYDIDEDLDALLENRKVLADNCMMISFSSLKDSTKECVYISTNATFKDNIFWDSNRQELAKTLIKRLNVLVPDLKYKVIVDATPVTLYNFTGNRNGSIHGWAPLLNQISVDLIKQKTEYKGLYLTGHWITQPGQGGLPMVMKSGHDVAKLLLKNAKRQVCK